MKPRPFDKLKTKFPDSGRWDMGWLDDADWVETLRIELECCNDPIAFDTETTSLDETVAGVVAVSFAGKDPTGGIWASTLCFTDEDCFPEWLDDWIEDATKPKIMANAKYDAHVLHWACGLTLRGVAGDVMLMSQVVDDDLQGHGLDALSLRHLNLEKIPTWAIIGKGKDFTGWGPVPRGYLALYANEDVVAAYMVWEKLNHKALDAGLAPVLKLEHDVLPVVCAMEQNGCLLDTSLLATLTSDFKVRAIEAAARARVLAKPARSKLAAEKRQRYEKLDAAWAKYKRGTAPKALAEARTRARTVMRSAEKDLNLGSPGQIQELLYGAWELHRKLGLRHPPKTKNQNPSTDHDTMVKLAPYSEFCQELLKHRQVSKLISTYTEKMPALIKPRTGRLHCTFWQCGTRTGRFSCSDPNLQNVPNRTEEGRAIRRAFIADEGMLLVAADYSQIEPRVAAHMSREPVWVEAYRLEQDLYHFTAEAIWGPPKDDEEKAARRNLAKTVTLACLYGAGAGKIAATAGITLEAAAAAIEAFWGTLSVLRAYLDDRVQEARDTGCVWTMNQHRRRHLPDIDHKWSRNRRAAENQAGNTPIQGTAADILKRAMVSIHPCLPTWEARMLLQIHDELLFELPHEKALAFADFVSEVMCSAADLIVPLEVGVEIGTNWAEAH